LEPKVCSSNRSSLRFYRQFRISYAIKMYIWFFICILGMFITIPLHFKSVEHIENQKKYGKEKGVRIGKIYGTISGTMEFIFLVGLWISPQPKFTIPILSNLSISIANFSTPILHSIISLPLVMLGAWIAIRGVKATRLEVAETHCTPKRLETAGVYSIVRHPQYFGWILSHVGMSILLSAWYSMLFTPILIVIIYLISKKEEDELIREFGKEYEDYQEEVPMMIPRRVQSRERATWSCKFLFLNQRRILFSLCI